MLGYTKKQLRARTLTSSTEKERRRDSRDLRYGKELSMKSNHRNWWLNISKNFIIIRFQNFVKEYMALEALTLKSTTWPAAGKKTCLRFYVQRDNITKVIHIRKNGMLAMVTLFLWVYLKSHKKQKTLFDCHFFYSSVTIFHSPLRI